MDIKWKDGNGNILNANKDRIIYLDASTNIKAIVRKEEVKKISIVDGLLNIFRDFDNDLIMTIVIPKNNKRNAVKIFNEYDKTGKTLKGKSNNFLLNLILESSVSNPIFGLSAIGIVFLVLIRFIQVAFGQTVVDIIRVLVIGYILYSITLYIFTRVKRKRLKEL